MTAKEKANDLVKKYWLKNKTGQDDFKTAIKNALICVDEILTFIEDADPQSLSYELIGYRDYWRQVKQEIENI